MATEASVFRPLLPAIAKRSACNTPTMASARQKTLGTVKIMPTCTSRRRTAAKRVAPIGEICGIWVKVRAMSPIGFIRLPRKRHGHGENLGLSLRAEPIKLTRRDSKPTVGGKIASMLVDESPTQSVDNVALRPVSILTNLEQIIRSADVGFRSRIRICYRETHFWIDNRIHGSLFRRIAMMRCLKSPVVSP